MSNTTSSAFGGFPIENEKIGETISIPTVEDFLKNQSTPVETVYDQHLEILKEEEKIIERKIEILNELQKLKS